MEYEYKDGYLCRFIDHSSPVLGSELDGCKGEMMIHQSKLCKAILDFEDADVITACLRNGEVLRSKANRLVVTLKMGAGKTKLAISLILANKLPKMKPIYFQSAVMQTRIFKPDRCIDPTFIVVRHSVYGQWIDQIKEFSDLRIYKAADSRSVVKLAKLLHGDLPSFNASYDIVLINYKNISGNVDFILDNCDNVFAQNKNKSKRIHMLLFNMLNRFYIRRLIYDDWDMLKIVTSPVENAGSCVYMSATDLGNTQHSQHVQITYANDPDKFKASMQNPAYCFAAMQYVPHIYVDDEFLDESIAVGLKNSDIKMMPPKPIVYIYDVENAENQAINIISELSNDEKIMESVNNLSSTSPSDVIRSLFSKRLEPYKRAIKIVNMYGDIDVKGLNDLPPPPNEETFTLLDIKTCTPIMYSYDNIANMVLKSLSDAQKTIQMEENMMKRVRTKIAENSCPICFESINTEPAAIMLCCNAVIHVSCTIRCKSNRCPLCRVEYGRTFMDTFVCLHHNTDISVLLDAKSSDDIVNIAEIKNNNVEVTKFTILHNIVACNFADTRRTRVDLNNFKSILFDEKSEAKEMENINMTKVLIYCSSNDTLNTIAEQLIGVIDFSRLTSSSTSTYKKIKRFKASTKPTAILANSWGDAAGIDFKTATDVVILNYIDSTYVLQQMLGRVLRIGQKHRPRIHLISYQNEACRWMMNYVRSAPSSN